MKANAVVTDGGKQLRADCFVERVEKFVLAAAVHRGHQFIDRKRLTKHRGRAQRVVTIRTHAIQTISDRLFHTLRNNQIGQLATFPASALSSHRALLDQRLHHFFNEERIAFRFAKDCFGKVAGDIFVQQRSDLRVGFFSGETFEDDARRKPFAVPINQRFRQRVRAVEFGITIRSCDQHALFAQVAHEMTEQPKRAAVGPVQIVEVKEQTLPPRQSCQHVCDGVEKQEALFVGGNS